MDVAEPHERRGRRGRAERAAAQKASAARAPQPRLPFSPVAAVSEDQLEAIHRSVAHHPCRNRHGLPPSGSEGDLERGRRRCRRGIRPGALRQGARRKRHRSCAQELHLACAQRGAQRRARRQCRRLLLGRERAERRRSRRWKASRKRRGFPQPPPARPFARRRASVGRISRGARRYSCLDPPSRCAFRHAHPVGQADPRLSASARDAFATGSRWRASRAASIARRSSASRRSSPSSTRPRRLRLDNPMLEGMIQMARANQVVVLTPFTLAGAMAPVTVVGRGGAAECRGAGRPRAWRRWCGRARPSSMAASPRMST